MLILRLCLPQLYNFQFQELNKTQTDRLFTSIYKYAQIVYRNKLSDGKLGKLSKIFHCQMDGPTQAK